MQKPKICSCCCIDIFNKKIIVFIIKQNSNIEKDSRRKNKFFLQAVRHPPQESNQNIIENNAENQNTKIGKTVVAIEPHGHQNQKAGFLASKWCKL